MKRKSIKSVLTVVLLLALTLSTFASCGKKGNNDDPSHTHTFAAEWSKDTDSHWHAATCEHTSEVKDKAAHTWNEGEITNEPTETETGEKTFTCTVCAQTKSEEIAKVSPDHEHSFAAEWSKDADSHWHAATCEHKSEAKDKAAHSWDKGKITTPSSCTSTGRKTFTCTVCGQTKSQTIPKTIHAPSKGWSYDMGTHYRTCTVCKERIDSTRSKHDAGYEDCGFCKTCGFEQDEIIMLKKNVYREFVATFHPEVNGSVYLKVTPADEYGTEYWRIEVEAAGGITEGRDYEIRIYDANGNEVTGYPETGKTYYIVIIGMNNVNDVRIIVMDHNAM